MVMADHPQAERTLVIRNRHSMRSPKTATLRALQGDPAAVANGLKREAGDSLRATRKSIPALPPQR
jgi:hypothetical protein